MMRMTLQTTIIIVCGEENDGDGGCCSLSGGDGGSVVEEMEAQWDGVGGFEGGVGRWGLAIQLG